MKRLAILFIVLALAATALPPDSGVTGKVRVTGRAPGETVPTLVFAEPLDGRQRPAPRRAKLTQKNKSFVPRVVAVPAGSTVEFPNDDPIFHNVFSLSSPEPFDLGLYRAGASKSRTFSEPATYQVFCNIHPEMAAVLLVLPTSFVTEAAVDGSYRLALPPGRYRVTAWSERAEPASAEITVGAGMATLPELTIDESKYVALPHKNKYGQDYSGPGYRPSGDRRP